MILILNKSLVVGSYQAQCGLYDNIRLSECHNFLITVEIRFEMNGILQVVCTKGHR